MSKEQRGRLYTAEQLAVKGRTEMGLAAAKGDKEELQRWLIHIGGNPSESDAYQETPLHLAAQFGELEIVKMLLKEHHVDVDPLNWESWTPLCFAVARGHSQVVKYLLRSQADGNWSSPLGWQLMHIAAWYNQSGMVQWLAQHGAQTALEDVHGCRPFDVTRPGQARRALYHAMVEERRTNLG